MIGFVFDCLFKFSTFYIAQNNSHILNVIFIHRDPCICNMVVDTMCLISTVCYLIWIILKLKLYFHEEL